MLNISLDIELLQEIIYYMGFLLYLYTGAFLYMFFKGAMFLSCVYGFGYLCGLYHSNSKELMTAFIVGILSFYINDYFKLCVYFSTATRLTSDFFWFLNILGQ